jgi:tetratricopeptide (TPR) repeat protein
VLATSLRYLGDLNGALDAVREARRAMEESEDDDARFNLISVLWREGVILGEDDGISLNRPREAAAVLRRAFDLAEEFARKDQSDYSSRARLAMAGRELGDILRHSDARGALEAYDLARHRLGEIKNNPKARRDEVWLLAGSSYALRSMRRFDQAGERIDRAFATLREIKEYPAERIEPGEQVAAAIRALGDHQAGTGRVAVALGTYQGLLEKVLAAKPQPEANLRHANSLSRIYQRLSELARRNGRKDLASAMAKRRFELWRHWNRKLPENNFVLRQMAAVEIRAPRSTLVPS